MNRIDKAIQLLNILSAGQTLPLDQLAYRLDMSIRSLQRLKNDLLEAGFEIESIKGPGGGYRLTGQGLGLQSLTEDEKNLLLQGLSLSLNDSQNSLGDDYLKAVGKFKNLLNTRDSLIIPSFQTMRLNVDPINYQENIKKLEKAIKNQVRVFLIYNKNRREQREYLFEPYRLLVINGMWYLTGFDQKNRYLSLKLIRIKSVNLSEENFRFDATYELEHKKYSKGHKIEPVSASILVTNNDYISEYIWGEDQKITWIDDFSFRLELVFPNEYALKKFLLSGGSSLYIEQPEEYRQFLVEEAKNVLKKYT